MTSTALQTSSNAPGTVTPQRSLDRRVIWAAAAAVLCCAINAAAAWVFRVWHPLPFGWGGDFYTEALPPLKLLAHGHLLDFIKTGPAYLGGIVVEAPFTLPAIWLGALGNLVYYFAVLPAMIAAALLTGWSLYRRGTRPRLTDLPLALIMVNPVTLCCVAFGHPEDIVAACLILGAVMEASRGSTRAAIVMIALGIIVQPFAILAAPLVWSLSPDPRRTGLATIGGAAIFWLPVILIHEVSLGVGNASGFVGVATGSINYPQQFFYWLGAGSWLAREAHLLIPLAAAVLTALWYRQQRSQPAADRTTEALWLLALVMLVRCAFDPWDDPYYHLPFLMTLMALDARSRRRLPILSVGASVVAYVLVSPDSHAALADPNRVAATYMVVAGLSLVLLSVRVYAPRRWQAGRATLSAAVARAGLSTFRQNSVMPGAKAPETGAMVASTENSFNRR